ncbi:hypothetical protein E1295_06075 [Nonomuraea mesophila]|uniref:DUF6891 domain-containing protein n=1 Tax=Nonomuraea mesophila TaxID=2530382 RepID=A0A4R5FV36_9ACTN|nr:hypothetical protein [Nonomuraea mesophila]TDE58174.1 hypothetical protein E1295_06075 [Nonomuraea mesophila]
MDDELLRKTLTAHIRMNVAIGRRTFEQVIRDAVDVWEMGADDHDLFVRTAEEIAGHAFAGHLAAQATWPQVTDCDRLSMAMIDLAMAGILSRESYTCCQNCASTEIGGELGDLPGMRGYAFYHQQDAQAAAGGGGVMLAYGATGDGDAAGIGAEIVAACRSRGLEPEWDGDVRQRIDVPLDWRRRRFGPLADHPGAQPPSAGPTVPVTFCDYTSLAADAPVDLTVQESRDLLLWMTPYAGNFVSYHGRPGPTLQFAWEKEMRLWAESPDPEARCFHGRHVTVDEALELITVHVTNGRTTLADLGEVETVPW